jgi:hypothetical protein
VPNSDEVAASLSEVLQAATNQRQGLARELPLQRILALLFAAEGDAFLGDAAER